MGEDPGECKADAFLETALGMAGLVHLEQQCGVGIGQEAAKGFVAQRRDDLPGAGALAAAALRMTREDLVAARRAAETRRLHRSVDLELAYAGHGILALARRLLLQRRVGFGKRAVQEEHRHPVRTRRGGERNVAQSRIQRIERWRPQLVQLVCLDRAADPRFEELAAIQRGNQRLFVVEAARREPGRETADIQAVVTVTRKIVFADGTAARAQRQAFDMKRLAGPRK